MKKDELSLFLEEMNDVKPLSTSDKHTFNHDFVVTEAQLERQKAAQKEIEDDINHLSNEYVELVEPDEILSFKRGGVQEGVFKNLRLGKYVIDATLNLQGVNLQQSRVQLFQFMQDCMKRNIRAILISHGTGKHSKPHPALLKSYINKWLQELTEVLAFHTALKHHGSYGATYVLLKKSEKLKQENREKHAKR
ncbi:DNA endonuclease SmrA [Flocculibacter collagenilyticus]|uniref:DNA endonuclease SmrA n=1 Tax=Flocculibacter collagenilyticus TaxID=2744479 RepID=UPI0018F340A7|nr:DNA endonuclease SmrA [Flocculibacter collagenilyticus]